MAHWDGEKHIYFEDEPWPDYPGWLMVDCGCCAGLEWGGEYPRECDSCAGNGSYAQHINSGVLAIYPGGPFLGSYSPRGIPIAV